MILRKNFKFYLILTLALFQSIFIMKINATPLNNIADSCPIYNTAGTDKFYKKLPQSAMLSLDISPYYQSANGGRNKNGNKVPLGDMFGSIKNSATDATTATYGSSWNMLAPFFDMSKMTPKNFSTTNYPNLFTAYQSLSGFSPNCTDQSNYEPDQITIDTVPNQKNSSIFQVAGKYEKLGLRGKLGFDTSIGLGVSIKSGVADYKIRPKFTALDPSVTTAPTNLSAQLYSTLLQESARNGIFKDLNLDVCEVRETEMEDTHVQIYWNIPFNIKEEGETVATVAPYLAVGGWLSSGNKKDYNRAFDISVGNNGHSGITAEGSLNFDFPGTIQLSMGGGVLWLEDEDFNTYRFASNQYQSGFYPWTTTVNVDPGLTWYFNASFKSENFMSVMPGFSFFFDYIYTYHEHDDYTITEPSSKRLALFEASSELMHDASSWKSQIVDFGVSYEVVKHLTIGFIVQAPISGIKVFRSVTSMGTVTISF